MTFIFAVIVWPFLSVAQVLHGEEIDLTVALNDDDECGVHLGANCALGLAQMRTSKLHNVESRGHVFEFEEGTDQISSNKHPIDGVSNYSHPAWIKACKKIFVDVGCNVGVNIRKMYEPKKYPGAKLLPFFDEHFGDALSRRATAEKSGLCAIGLEPNPEHAERLQKIENLYQQQGWNVHFYSVAAWSSDGMMPFNKTGQRTSPDADLTHKGAHLSMHLAETQHVPESSLVPTVNLASFIATLPARSVKLMLMDIEGAEYETLAQLMMEKKLCQASILNLLVEAHDWGDITKWGGPTSFTEGVHPRSTMAIGERISQMMDMGWCPSGENVTYVAKLDDETYSKDVDESFAQR